MKKIILLLMVFVLFGCAADKENTVHNSNYNSNLTESDKSISADNSLKEDELKQIRIESDGEKLLLTSDGKLELKLSVYLADTDEKRWIYIGGYTDANVVKGTTVRIHLNDPKTVFIKGDSFGEIEFELFSANSTDAPYITAFAFCNSVVQYSERVIGMIVEGRTEVDKVNVEMFDNPSLLPEGIENDFIAIVMSVK